jgi:hypothetical protein
VVYSDHSCGANCDATRAHRRTAPSLTEHPRRPPSPRCSLRTTAATPAPSAAIPARARRQVSSRPSPATCLSPAAQPAPSSAVRRRVRSGRRNAFSPKQGGRFRTPPSEPETREIREQVCRHLAPQTRLARTPGVGVIARVGGWPRSRTSVGRGRARRACPDRTDETRVAPTTSEQSG